MACPLCGEVCHCSSSPGEDAAAFSASESHISVLIDPDAPDMSEEGFAASLANEPVTADLTPKINVASMIEAPPASFYRPAEDSAWREEVASRVATHRARRRRKFDPDSSLSLNFDRENNARAWADSGAPLKPGFGWSGEQGPQFVPAETKIIEFPKPLRVHRAHEPVPEQYSFAEELAEPIIEQPRIVEVVDEPHPIFDQEQPLAGITLDAVPTPPPAPEFELPLRTAPLAARAFSGLIDATVVLSAAGIFVMIFLAMNRALPESRLALLYAALIPGLFFAAYEYLFLVYEGATPGMTLAGLELATFDRKYPSRLRRACRALAMMVSCVSVGLGFAWAALDEDSLCWHDRITRTHLT
jgi:uncharacterized RDD family membrane protein YckC